MDVLSEVLRAVRLQGRVFCRAELTAPWGLDAPVGGGLAFHVVQRGSCYLRVGGESAPRALAGGDLVVLPRKSGHRLNDLPDSPAVPMNALAHELSEADVPVLRHGGAGAPTTLICGHFVPESEAASALVDALPAVVHIKAERARSMPWLDETLKFIGAEVTTSRPGGDAVIGRLVDVLLVQVLRAWMESEPEDRRGWLGALRDPQIAAALGQLHREPGRDWTTESLAQAVGMSRSAFAARFSSLVGLPPMEYLTRFRIRLAAGRLQEGSAALAQIAAAVGYDSEIAFNRAFKREMGVAPGAYRRARR